MAANPHNHKYAAVNPKYAAMNSLPSAVGVRRELRQERLLVKQLHKILPPIISSQYSLAPPLMLLQQLLLPLFPSFSHQQSKFGRIVTPLSTH